MKIVNDKMHDSCLKFTAAFRVSSSITYRVSFLFNLDVGSDSALDSMRDSAPGMKASPEIIQITGLSLSFERIFTPTPLK